MGRGVQPGTDDVRDSPGLDIACRLHLLGAEVTVYDPMATGNALTVSPELAYADSAMAALHRADVTVVVAAWREFAEISPVAAVRRRRVDDCCGRMSGHRHSRLARGWLERVFSHRKPRRTPRKWVGCARHSSRRRRSSKLARMIP